MKTTNPTSPHFDDETMDQFLAGTLSDQESISIESHLNSCDDCATKISSVAASQWPWDEVAANLATDDFDAPSKETEGDREQDPIALLQRELSGWLDPTDEPNMLGRFAGYEIVGIIGHGGMGIVLKGFERALNRYVAIKVLAPRLASNGTARKRFEREARAAAAVLHDNVIAIHRVDQWHGLPFLVMPYVAGESLQQRIDRDGPLETEAILRIGGQIAAGLSAAHAQGLVHRDIKPSNILLDQGVERVTITDFGLARAADDATITRTGFVAGTPLYMSPEQASGEPIDHRSDLFSLGSVMYTMATGFTPFNGEEHHSVLKKIQTEPAPDIRGKQETVPNWLAEMIDWCHAKLPKDRPQKAKVVEQFLGEWLTHLKQPQRITQPATIEIPKRSLRNGSPPKNGLRNLIAGLGGLLFLIAGIFITIESSKGTITIESEIDDIPVTIKKGSKVYESLQVSRDGTSVRLFAGEYQILLDGNFDDVQVDDNLVELKSGENPTVRIRKLAKASPAENKVGATATGRGEALPKASSGNPQRLGDRSGPLAIGDIVLVHVPAILPPLQHGKPFNPPPIFNLDNGRIVRGFPFQIQPDGTLRLPMVDPIPVVGKTLQEAEEAFKDAYVSSDILRPSVKTRFTRFNETPVEAPQSIQVGDVVAAYLPGVIPTVDQSGDENVLVKKYGDNQIYTGYPLPVASDGSISVPFLEPIRVVGLSVREAEQRIYDRYITKNILKPRSAMPLLTCLKIKPKLKKGRTKRYTVGNYLTEALFKLDQFINDEPVDSSARLKSVRKETDQLIELMKQTCGSSIEVTSIQPSYFFVKASDDQHTKIDELFRVLQIDQRDTLNIGIHAISDEFCKPEFKSRVQEILKSDVATAEEWEEANQKCQSRYYRSVFINRLAGEPGRMHLDQLPVTLTLRVLNSEGHVQVRVDQMLDDQEYKSYSKVGIIDKKGGAMVFKPHGSDNFAWLIRPTPGQDSERKGDPDQTWLQFSFPGPRNGILNWSSGNESVYLPGRYEIRTDSNDYFTLKHGLDSTFDQITGTIHSMTYPDDYRKYFESNPIEVKLTADDVKQLENDHVFEKLFYAKLEEGDVRIRTTEAILKGPAWSLWLSEPEKKERLGESKKGHLIAILRMQKKPTIKANQD